MAVAIESKVCNRCGEEKPLTEFRWHKVNKWEGPRTHCRPCEKALAAEAHERDPDSQRWRTVRWRYGIDKEDYLRMAEEQGWACAICGITDDVQRERKNKYRHRYWLHIDHDHETGDIRGLLCYTCNVGVGMLGTHGKLRAAIDYLRPWMAEEEGGGVPRP